MGIAPKFSTKLWILPLAWVTPSRYSWWVGRNCLSKTVCYGAELSCKFSCCWGPYKLILMRLTIIICTDFSLSLLSCLLFLFWQNIFNRRTHSEENGKRSHTDTVLRRMGKEVTKIPTKPCGGEWEKKSQRYRQNHAEENGKRSHKDTDKTMLRSMGKEVTKIPTKPCGGEWEKKSQRYRPNHAEENGKRSHKDTDKII